MSFFRQITKPAPVFFPWVGDIHDSYFQRQHIQYSEEEKRMSLTVWRPEGGVWRQPWRDRKKKEDRLWEGLTIVVTGVDSLDVRVTEKVPYFELSTVYSKPGESRIVFECHYAVDIVAHGAGLGAKLLSAIVGPKRWQEVFE